MRYLVRLLGSALLLPSLVLLVGCAATGESVTAGGVAESGKGDVPSFTGPWAEDFSYMYGKATTDFERKVLVDEKVSDAEFAEMESRFRACLSSYQIIFSGFKPGGGFSFDFPEGMGSEKANKLTDDCSASSGLSTVGSLYFMVQKNPQHLNEATIMVECLAKKQVVPPGYSASDYDRDTPTMSFPFENKDLGKKALEECSADPLGLLTQSK